MLKDEKKMIDDFLQDFGTWKIDEQKSAIDIFFREQDYFLLQKILEKIPAIFTKEQKFAVFSGICDEYKR